MNTTARERKLFSSALSLGRSPSSLGSSPRSAGAVSTFEAVVHEVIDEEVKNESARQMQEQEEAAKAQKPRSWLTAWMFAKTPQA
jgi:hypothetical protein